MARLAPGDNITLSILLSPDGIGSETTRTVKCYVYDPADTQITGSPFALTHIANGMYTNNNAYSVSSKGFYKHIYIVYDDAGATDESDQYPRKHETIEVKSEPIFGQSLVDANVIGLDNKVIKKIAEEVWKYENMGKVLISKPNEIPAPIVQKINIEPLQEIQNTLKIISNKTFDISPVLKAISELKTSSNIDKFKDEWLFEIRNVKQNVLDIISKSILSSGNKFADAVVKSKTNIKPLLTILTFLEKSIVRSKDLEELRSNLNKDLTDLKQSKMMDKFQEMQSAILAMNTASITYQVGEAIKKTIFQLFKNSENTTVEMVNKLNEQEARRLLFLLEEMKGIFTKNSKDGIQYIKKNVISKFDGISADIKKSKK